MLVYTCQTSISNCPTDQLCARDAGALAQLSFVFIAVATMRMSIVFLNCYATTRFYQATSFVAGWVAMCVEHFKEVDVQFN